MIVTGVAASLFFVLKAAAALRDRRPATWLVCLMSVAMDFLSVGALTLLEFATLRCSGDALDVPIAAAKVAGEAVHPDSVGDQTAAELRQIQVAEMWMQRVRITLLMLLELGSSAVFLMRAWTWRWIIMGRGA